jgi:hypothetical protein
MPDENAPEPKPASARPHRTAAKLFRIAGGVFALVGILSAIDARWPLSVTFLSLCVVFITAVQRSNDRSHEERAKGTPSKLGPNQALQLTGAACRLSGIHCRSSGPGC